MIQFVDLALIQAEGETDAIVVNYELLDSLNLLRRNILALANHGHDVICQDVDSKKRKIVRGTSILAHFQVCLLREAHDAKDRGQVRQLGG